MWISFPPFPEFISIPGLLPSFWRHYDQGLFGCNMDLKVLVLVDLMLMDIIFLASITTVTFLCILGDFK